MKLEKHFFKDWLIQINEENNKNFPEKIKNSVLKIISLENLQVKKLVLEIKNWTKKLEKKDFLRIIKNKTISTTDLQKITNFVDFSLEFEEVENILKNKKVPNFNKYLLARKVKKDFKNIEKLQKIWLEPRGFLFECVSDSWIIFEEILKNILENKSDLYTEMRKIVKNFLEKKSIPKNIYSENEVKNLKKIFEKQNDYFFNLPLDLSEDKIDLSIYMRYWHKIDHPEIAELFVLFFDEILKNKSSRYIDKIRLIPRFSDMFEPKELIKNTNVNFLKVNWTLFKKAMFFNTVPVFLSNSWFNFPYQKDFKNKDLLKTSFKTPFVISAWMKNFSNFNSINSGFELENDQNYHSWIENQKERNSKLELDEILEIFFKIFLEIEKKLTFSLEEQKINNDIFLK